MPLSSVIKARRGMLAFSFVWTEQGSIHMQTILHMQIGNDFVNVPTRTYANSDYFKRSALLFWDTNPPPLSWKYWRSVALNPDGPRSDLYAESRASYKYWRKDAVGGGGQMLHLRNGPPEHHTKYHLPLSESIPFDQNNCRQRRHPFCHLHRHRPPSHQTSLASRSVGSDEMLTSERRKSVMV